VDALSAAYSPTSGRPIPAVVVGGTLNGLGVVRSLARGHMPIYLLETTRRCAAGWSRHCTLVPVGALEGRSLIETLVTLGKRLACRPVLILTSDQSVNSVSAYREEIEPLYRISLPSDGLVRALADKTLFQELAEREDFPVPRAVCVAGTADLERLSRLEPPLVIKPADKTLVLSGIVERAVRVATIGDARRACEQMLALAPRLVVQEWIEGPDTEIFFTLFSCDRAGRLLGLFPGRKLVCSPPAVGSTAVGVPAPEMASVLTEPTLRFIERLGYRGLGSLEFKRDSHTGRCLIIEPTVGRTDWQEELATLCGMNLPLMTYSGELGQQPPAAGTQGALRAWRESARFRAPLAPGVRAVDGFFRWSDPLPALYYYGYEGGLIRAARGAARAWARVFSSNGRRQE
jgi:D-aspartate ligase